MVDLVKLRKKAKKASELAAGGSRLAEDERAAGSAQRADQSAEGRAQSAEELAAGGSAPASRHPEAGAGADAPSPSQDDKVERQPGNPVTGSSTTASSTPASRQPPAASSPDKLARFKEEAGKLRETIEQATEAQPSTDQLELLTFVIAGEHYAVDIERIVEIVRPRSVTRVPNADTSIVGIVSLRGTIVTLVDVRKRLRHAVAEETPDTRIIVVDHQGETIGFEVERVLRVVKIGRGDVGGHPVVHASEADDCIRGVFRHAGALTILLDFDKLLALPHGNHL